MYKKIKKEVSWSLLSKAVSFALFLATNVVLARQLGVAGYGNWSYFLAVFNILCVIGYAGVNYSSQKYAAQYSKTKEIGKVLVSSFICRIAISIIFAGIMFVLKEPLLKLFKGNIQNEYFWVIILLCFLGAIIEWLKKVFTGLHRLKYCFYINISEFTLKFGFVLILLFYSTTVFSVVKAYSLSFIITVSIGLILLIKNFISWTPDTFNINEDNLGIKILKYSMPLFFMSLGYFFATDIDTVMLGILSSQDQVGYYSAAKQVVGKLPHIAMAISMGIMPVFAHLNKEHINEKKQLLNKAITANALLFGAISFVILLGAGYLTTLLFGKEYMPSAQIMRILIIYMLVFSFSHYIVPILIYQGKALWAMSNLYIMTLFNIAFNYILIPLYGAKGAAIATSSAYIPYIIINFLLVRHLLNSKKIVFSETL